VLKPYVEDPEVRPVEVPPGPVLVEGEEEWYVQEILNHRQRRYGRGQPRLELLVRWQFYGPEEDQWLPLSEVEETEAYDKYEREMIRIHGRAGWPPK
jgi:hypothetical protein